MFSEEIDRPYVLVLMNFCTVSIQAIKHQSAQRTGPTPSVLLHLPFYLYCRHVVKAGADSPSLRLSWSIVSVLTAFTWPHWLTDNATRSQLPEQTRRACCFLLLSYHALSLKERSGFSFNLYWYTAVWWETKRHGYSLPLSWVLHLLLLGIHVTWRPVLETWGWRLTGRLCWWMMEEDWLQLSHLLCFSRIMEMLWWNLILRYAEC